MAFTVFDPALQKSRISFQVKESQSIHSVYNPLPIGLAECLESEYCGLTPIVESTDKLMKPVEPDLAILVG